MSWTYWNQVEITPDLQRYSIYTPIKRDRMYILGVKFRLIRKPFLVSPLSGFSFTLTDDNKNDTRHIVSNSNPLFSILEENDVLKKAADTTEESGRFSITISLKKVDNIYIKRKKDSKQNKLLLL